MSDFTWGSTGSAGSWSLPAKAGSLMARLGVMWRARRTRQMLSEMDDRLLADIGVGRGEALVEAGRPMWDVAPTRR